MLGATSGIGAETARVLALRGVRVVIPARNLKKGREVRERILLQRTNAEVIVMEIDLSSFTSIKRFCSEFLSSGLPLNILMYVPLIDINEFDFYLIILPFFSLILCSVSSMWTEGMLLFSFRNNAGVYSPNLEFSEQKVELTFATNYLG